MKKNILILAGGLGTRMKSETPKVMHKILGKPILEYIVQTSLKLNPDRIILLLGNSADSIKRYFSKYNCIDYAFQKKQLGSGDAVKSAIHYLDNNANVLILSGDVPLISYKTLNSMLSFHENNKNTITILTMKLDNPYGYGRIVKDNGNVKCIIEEKDASEEYKKIKEVNSGIYCMNNDFLKKHINKLNNDNAQKEYYITDMIKIAYKENVKIDTFETKNNKEVLGINNRQQLSFIESIMLNNKKQQLMLEGVTFENEKTVYIDTDVKIEKDVIIENGVTVKGHSIIKSGSIIKAGSYINNSVIEANSIIKPNSVIDNE